MRYDKDHKAETHKRVVEAASRRFRRDGIEATGVVDLMADAGLTHGGFYAHFPSKETLVREAIVAASEKSRVRLRRQIDDSRAGKRDALEDIVRNYLSAAHRDRPDRGCSIAALGSEIARHPRKTKDAFSEGLAKTLALIEDTLPGSPSPQRQQKSTAIFAVMIGALQLSRAIGDAEASQAALDAGIAAALTVAKSGAN